MFFEIFKNFVLNISFLVCVGNMLIRLQPTKDLMMGRDYGRHYYLNRILMTLIFGGMGICATYLGIGVYGANVNTRVICIISGGMLGGPFVGIGAGLIAGIHRYFIDPSGLTSLACAISSVLEGFIGAFGYQFLRRKRWEKLEIFMVGFLAELLQMIIILFVAKPYEAAQETVTIIAFPMIICNSLGLMIFITSFKGQLRHNDTESAANIRTVFDITEKCLPFLREGLHNDDNIRKICQILLKASEYRGVFFADAEHLRYVCYMDRTHNLIQIPAQDTVSEFIVDTAQKNKVQYYEYLKEKNDSQGIFSSIITQYDIAVAPLKVADHLWGCIGILTDKYQVSNTRHLDFIDGIAKIFSTQLALNDFEEQRRMLQKAEFQALQSQINPHFLFNALNTISSFCRTKPERARQLLVSLSIYFRRTLEGGGQYMIPFLEEMEHVRSYLEIESARFEDRLQVEYHVPDDIDYMVPSLIVQPIVENAIKHGAMKHEQGVIRILVKKDVKQLIISIQDSGDGISKELIQALYAGNLDSDKVGLANVQKRLVNMYGVAYGLKIKTSTKGTTIKIIIPKRED